MTISYLMLCKYANIAKGSNSLCVNEVIEQMQAEQYPATLQNPMVVFQLVRTPNETTTPTIQLSAENNGAEIFSEEYSADFGEHLRHRVLGSIKQITIPEVGVLDIILRCDDEILDSFRIDVTLLEH